MIYEILTIIPAKFADTEIEAVSERIAKQIEAAGGKIEKTENLGKLKLAYAINHVRYGTYVLFYIEAAQEIMAKVDQGLRLADEVLRHMIVVHPKGMPRHTPRPTSYVPPLNAEGRRSSEKGDDKPARHAEVAAKIEEKPLSTKDLDKKLDEILDSDIMKSI
jgi:ribosomal protein S6